MAWRLGNRNPSHLYGWYVLVSPEDLPLMKDYNWCGNCTNNGLEVRRREVVDGKIYSIHLNREIWGRMHPHGTDHYGRVYRHGHTLDFRRMHLSLNQQVGVVQNKRLRGIVAHNGGWQVQITGGDGLSRYIGRTSSKEDGYRMYNRYLRDLKEKHPQDRRIQSMSFNEIDPLF